MRMKTEMNHTKGQPGTNRNKTPERLCMACRVKSGKRELIRIVRTPEKTVMIDRTGKMNGRGAYVCRNPECIAKVRKTGALAKALAVPVPESIFEALMQLSENVNE